MLWNHRTPSQLPHIAHRDSREKIHVSATSRRNMLTSKTFCCEECKKTFRYKMALHLYEEHCGKEKPKPFKCSDYGKCFTRTATLEHYQQHFHLSQQGSGLKRAVEEEKKKEVKQAKRDLPKKIDKSPLNQTKKSLCWKGTK